MNNYFKVLFFCLTFVFSYVFFYQITLAYSCPNYLFGKDLVKGTNDPDVAVVQEILNLDKRTKVAYTGAGSPGNETTSFGKATREALKRFQALFIEYVGIADGKFTSRTRTTMNAVCKGPFFTGKGKNVYDIATTSDDRIPPVVAITGPKMTYSDAPFRAFVGANEPIDKPTLDGLIIDGATAGDLRKMSSTSYSFVVTPNQDVKDQITLQFEAETIADIAGNKNDKASNEWDVTVIMATNTVATDTTATDTSLLDYLNSILPNASSSSSKDCSAVTSVDVSDYSNPCYGKVPMKNNAAQSQQDQKKDDQTMQMIMQLLTGLLKGLTGAGGGGQDGGGKGAGSSACACSGEQTIGLFGLSGPSGRAKDTLNPGMGDYISNKGIAPNTAPCGQAKGPQGQCINPQNDMTGQPVMWNILGPDSFKWAR